MFWSFFGGNLENPDIPLIWIIWTATNNLREYGHWRELDFQNIFITLTTGPFEWKLHRKFVLCVISSTGSTWFTGFVSTVQAWTHGGNDSSVLTDAIVSINCCWIVFFLFLECITWSDECRPYRLCSLIDWMWSRYRSWVRVHFDERSAFSALVIPQL